MYLLCIKTIYASKKKKSCSYLLRHTGDLFAYTDRDSHAAFEVWSTGIIGRFICLTYSSFCFSALFILVASSFALCFHLKTPNRIELNTTVWRHMQSGNFQCRKLCCKVTSIIYQFRNSTGKIPRTAGGSCTLQLSGKKNHSWGFLLNFRFPSTKKYISLFFLIGQCN